MSPHPIPGRCLCGAVRFTLTPPTNFLSICHCRSCRLAHGAASVAWTSVPRERFVLESGQEQLRWYASSPWIRWGFCGTCGSSMLYEATGEGHHESPALDRIYVSAGSLEGPLDRTPQAHVSYEERLPWDRATDGVPCTRGKGLEPMEP